MAAVLAACQNTELSLSEAGTKLRASGIYPQQETIPLPQSMTTADWQRNAVLRQRMTALAEKRLIEISLPATQTAGDIHFSLTATGERYRAKPARNDDEINRTAKQIVLSVGTKVLDHVDTVGPLLTAQGVKVRDVEFTWHYESVTPIGEVLGLVPDKPERARVAPVLFGNEWRFIGQ